MIAYVCTCKPKIRICARVYLWVCVLVYLCICKLLQRIRVWSNVYCLLCCNALCDDPSLRLVCLLTEAPVSPQKSRCKNIHLDHRCHCSEELLKLVILAPSGTVCPTKQPNTKASQESLKLLLTVSTHRDDMHKSHWQIYEGFYDP